MKPASFEQATHTMTAPPGMDDCEDLPAYRDGRFILSCWEMSWRERLAALFLGRCWLWIRSEVQPPVALEVRRSPFPRRQPNGKAAATRDAKCQS